MAGQVYKDKATLKDVMEHYAISERFQFRVDRSNAISYALLCMSEDCEWRFKASSYISTRGYGHFNRRCTAGEKWEWDVQPAQRKDKVYEQRQASSSLIGGMIRLKLTNHKRKYTLKDIIDNVKTNLGVDVSYMLAWRAKEKAMNFLRGKPTDSYNKLPGYLYTMDMIYPGSHIRMVKSPQNEFKYVYISLYAFIKEFDQCRPIVVVDGSHLKSYYTRTFVSANNLDGAGHILPLAYGVIDSENDAAWTWFFEQFKEVYGEMESMYIVSDRNESIIKFVSRVYPTVYIRVKDYLELAGYEKWARLYAPVNRGWKMTSNIVESINAALVSSRELTIYNLLEEVRKMFGRWNCSNRKEALQTYTTLGKKYQEMLTLNEAMSIRMT
uniref:Uncharacterized protein n=1 Tax=Nicotiana tabacum TaxID=4097 RepID=A0A1S3YWC6_TOBAC